MCGNASVTTRRPREGKRPERTLRDTVKIKPGFLQRSQEAGYARVVRHLFRRRYTQGVELAQDKDVYCRHQR